MKEALTFVRLRITFIVAGFFLFPGISGQEFYFGNDLSYVNQMEDCGAVYKEDGVPKDVYEIFADHGTNLVRVRLWVDPSWWQDPLSQPAGVKPHYSDLEDVKETISRAKGAGMKVMLGFQYSDFWADPGRQLIPRAWLDVAYSLPALKDSVYNYTARVLNELDSEGLMPDFVKVGNENNGGILRHIPEANGFEPATSVSTSWSRHAQLFNAGITAVRDVGSGASINPKIVIHFTNSLGGQVNNYNNIIANGVTDFDVIGISYYYAWHGGSISELETTISSLVQNFPGYDVMVAETGYLWTTVNHDALGNIISTPDPEYLPVSPENQLKYMVDFAWAVKRGGGNGVIFWEPAWVSTPCRTPWGVGSSHDHVVFFDPDNTNFMDNGGGRWCEPQFYDGQDSVNVTFKVKMSLDADLSRGVYIVGEITNWLITPMDAEGDRVYAKTFRLPPSNNLQAYYYLTTDTWDNYLDYRETVPAECALKWESDRGVVIPVKDTVLAHYWGSCEVFSSVAVDQKEIDNPSLVRLFPNPVTNSELKLESSVDDNLVISILNVQGKRVCERNLEISESEQFTIDLYGFTGGIYMVKLYFEELNRFESRLVVISR